MLPLFHVFGLSSVLNVTVRYAGTMVLVPRFEIPPVVDAIEKHRCTIFSGVPTMYFALLNTDLSGRDLSSLRVGVSGGAAIPGETIRAFEEKFPGCVILEGYGLSESASTTTFNINAEQRKVLSIGKPIWGVEVHVVDEDDKPLPAGEEHVGELVIRGHNIMKGYYKKPEATAEAFKNGWFHTGDLGYQDEDGFFFIVDRKKDLIIRGGYNVYPREIEEVLFEHPAVAEAAVIGKPDDKLGEEVVAVVALKQRRRRHARRHQGLLQGAARGVQVPARGADRRRPAQGPDRQDPQEGAALSQVATVLGPVDTADLGTTLMHEHVFTLTVDSPEAVVGRVGRGGARRRGGRRSSPSCGPPACARSSTPPSTASAATCRGCCGSTSRCPT